MVTSPTANLTSMDGNQPYDQHGGASYYKYSDKPNGKNWWRVLHCNMSRYTCGNKCCGKSGDETDGKSYSRTVTSPTASAVTCTVSNPTW